MYNYAMLDWTHETERIDAIIPVGVVESQRAILLTKVYVHGNKHDRLFHCQAPFDEDYWIMRCENWQ